MPVREGLLEQMIRSRLDDRYIGLANNAFGKGVYGATESLKLINFRRETVVDAYKSVSRQTVDRWLRGYNYEFEGETLHSEPLWQPDFATDEDQDFEVSFRDLIELRFVKAFRDFGLSLQTIRACFERAVEEVQNPRPFSTQKFQTDGKTIFLEITQGLDDPKLLDLRRKQGVFRSFVAPTFKDLEFDADAVARWYPLGASHKSIVIDPARSFGRPIAGYGVPTEVLRDAIKAEKSEERVAKLYELPLATVREAAMFEQRLAA